MTATAKSADPLLPEPGQLTAALLIFLQEEIRNRSMQTVPGSLLSLCEACAQPCQAWLPIREARLPRRGQSPASSPPDPLPANQGPTDTRWGWGGCRLSAVLPCFQEPSCCSSRRGSALCPRKFETIRPMFTASGLSSSPSPTPCRQAGCEASEHILRA